MSLFLSIVLLIASFSQVYIATFSLGIGAIPWIIMSEVSVFFPLKFLILTHSNLILP